MCLGKNAVRTSRSKPSFLRFIQCFIPRNVRISDQFCVVDFQSWEGFMWYPSFFLGCRANVPLC